MKKNNRNNENIIIMKCMKIMIMKMNKIIMKIIMKIMKVK